MGRAGRSSDEPLERLGSQVTVSPPQFSFFEAHPALVAALQALNWDDALAQEHLPARIPTESNRVYVDSIEDGTIERLTEQGGHHETWDAILIVEAKRPGADVAPAWDGLRELMRDLSGVLHDDPEIGGTINDSLLRDYAARARPLPDNKGWIATAVVRVQMESRTG